MREEAGPLGRVLVARELPGLVEQPPVPDRRHELPVVLLDTKRQHAGALVSGVGHVARKVLRPGLVGKVGTEGAARLVGHEHLNVNEVKQSFADAERLDLLHPVRRITRVDQRLEVRHHGPERDPVRTAGEDADAGGQQVLLLRLQVSQAGQRFPEPRLDFRRRLRVIQHPQRRKARQEDVLFRAPSPGE